MMDTMEPGVEMFAPETILKSDTEDDVPMIDTKDHIQKQLSAKDDELISMETLRESPVQWPERFPGMDEFMTTSDTPIHTPNMDSAQSLTEADMATLNEMAALTPNQIIQNIKSMHDQIYQLGLVEAKEMTRGKLLGIFERMGKGKK